MHCLDVNRKISFLMILNYDVNVNKSLLTKYIFLLVSKTNVSLFFPTPFEKKYGNWIASWSKHGSILKCGSP